MALINKRFQDLLAKSSLKTLTNAEKSELIEYAGLFNRQISYNRRFEYFTLIRQYLTEKLSPSHFRAKFLEMDKEDDEATDKLKKDFEQLSSFSITLELKRTDAFSKLLNLIYEHSISTLEFGPDYGISENEFKVSIEEALNSF